MTFRAWVGGIVFPDEVCRKHLCHANNLSLSFYTSTCILGVQFITRLELNLCIVLTGQNTTENVISRN
jgi:hypothetical protein